jgi:hypothetical protein
MNLATWEKRMAGNESNNGPLGNMNAFKHGLASIQTRPEEGIPIHLASWILNRSKAIGLQVLRGHREYVHQSSNE